MHTVADACVLQFLVCCIVGQSSVSSARMPFVGDTLMRMHLNLNMFTCSGRGLLRELTGEDYENCQIRSYELLDGGELLPITVPVEMNIEMSA